MQVPALSTRSDILYDRYGTYHAQRMFAVEGLKHLAEQFEGTQEELRVHREAVHAAERVETGARANRDSRESELMDDIRGFGSQVKVQTRRSVTGASYERYFPGRGVSDVLYLPRAKRLLRIKAIIVLLGEETDPVVVQIGEGLKASYERYLAAEAAFAAAVAARQEARIREKNARRTWIAGYRDSHAELVKVFSKTDPSRADAFFAPVRPRSGDVEEEFELDEDLDLDEAPVDEASGSGDVENPTPAPGTDGSTPNGDDPGGAAP
jgi:hypothetical protein